MFSVIETGGKQYKVSVGDKIKVEKIEGEAGSKIEFDKVLLLSSDEGVKIGEPYVDKAKVTAEIISQKKDKKKIVFKYKPKKRERTKKGHRQPYTEVKITEIK